MVVVIVEVLTWLDDHRRYALDVTAHQPVTGPIVRDRFLAAVARFGVPASTLTLIQSRWCLWRLVRSAGRGHALRVRRPSAAVV